MMMPQKGFAAGFALHPSPLRGGGGGGGEFTRSLRVIPPSLTLPRKGGGNGACAP
jgi:hypothetical protein